jgi:hypothetical protein
MWYNKDMNKPHRGFKRVLALPDKHIPYQDKRALKAVFKYMGEEWWDEVIDLGDLLDLGEISDWAAGKPGEVENARIQETFDAGNAYWDKVQDLATRQNPKCKQVYIQGNHEYRIERLYKKYPVLTGSLDIRDRLNLDSRGIKWVAQWAKGEIHQVGQLYFAHGYSTAVNHSLTTARLVGAHIVYAHAHDRQQATDKRIGHNNGPRAASIGCLCDLDQHYLNGGPTRWELGFGVYDFYPDGAFQEHYVRLQDYKFIGPTNGKIYRG